jgi:hypothetical protein
MEWIETININDSKNSIHVSIDRIASTKSLNTATLEMSKPLGLDLASKRQRTRKDYTYREDYRTRW